MRGPNVADPRNPDTIRKSHSTVALTRQALHEGSAPRMARPSPAKGVPASVVASPVAEIKVDAPGRRGLLCCCSMHAAMAITPSNNDVEGKVVVVFSSTLGFHRQAFLLYKD